MIAGVGTDIVAVERLGRFYERHAQRALDKLLAPSERDEFAKVKESVKDSARFLAKRFAAKEAFGKALGIGVVAPATLANVAVAHDAAGRPFFEYAPPLAAYLAERGLSAHLSISDEREFAVAFVILEHA